MRLAGKQSDRRLQAMALGRRARVASAWPSGVAGIQVVHWPAGAAPAVGDGASGAVSQSQSYRARPGLRPARSRVRAFDAAPPIAYGARVSPEFCDRVRAIAAGLGCDPSHLMAAMAFETGETFSPSIRNPRSSATGLIQFMSSTAEGLGTTTDALAAMTAVEQLDYVERYLRPYAGRMPTLEDVYMTILWPRAVGRANDTVLFSRPSRAYVTNQGLDADRDGAITKAEAAAPVRRRLQVGMEPGNLR